MDLNLSISNRQITPGVVKMFQFENGTTTLRITLDSYMHDAIDLRNYIPYAITSINGQIDMTELESEMVEGKLVLSWTVQDYSLRQIGAVQYQIVFKENEGDGENSAVFYSYKAILLVRESLDGDNQITAYYPTLLKQWLDRLNALSGTYDAGIVYVQPGETLDASKRLAGRLYYIVENERTYEGHFEDHNGDRLGEFNAKYVTNANLNTLLNHGEYICSGSIANLPISSTYAAVRVVDSGSTNRVVQEVAIPAEDNTVRVFVRAVTGINTFGAWKELVSPDYVDARQRDNDFAIRAMAAMHTNDWLDLWIENFENQGDSSFGGDPSTSVEFNRRLSCVEIASGHSSANLESEYLNTGSGARIVYVLVDWEDMASESMTVYVAFDNEWYEAVPTTMVQGFANTSAFYCSVSEEVLQIRVRLELYGNRRIYNVAVGAKK